MTVRCRSLLAAALGLWMAHPLLGQEPARLGVGEAPNLAARPQVSANQQMANTIAEHLKQSGQLRRYTIDIAFQNGTAELTGSVADQAQREEALRLVQGVAGVERVRDRMTIGSASGLVQVQAPPPAPRGFGGGPISEPVPVVQAPVPSPYDVNPPKMPPYAWPTYAPYNNLSRVAYPTDYPYNAFPFIGPVYPFPKVPLSWRAVKLQFEDGHWWYSRTATNHDWWRLRYW